MNRPSLILNLARKLRDDIMSVAAHGTDVDDKVELLKVINNFIKEREFMRSLRKEGN